MRVEAKRADEYRGAYDAWQEQLQAVHRALLDGEPLDPPKLKGLLNREARAKERYDSARLALLGLDPVAADEDPFANVGQR